MPTYDYVCDACGYAFELFQSMRDPVKRTCPECKARKLRRLIGTGAAILVGGRSTDPGTSETWLTPLDAPGSPIPRRRRPTSPQSPPGPRSP